MTVPVIANLLRFIALILLQALVIDNFDLGNGWVVPYLYVFFILALPIELPVWAALLLGGTTGLTMDFFSSTPGMHASACLVMAYARGYMLRALAPREGYAANLRPTVNDMGMAWFITYAGVLIVIHHLWLFFVEIFRFDGFFATFSRALVSAAATLMLCLLVQALTTRSTARSR
jgi:rod shape-determining protein MreD